MLLAHGITIVLLQAIAQGSLSDCLVLRMDAPLSYLHNIAPEMLRRIAQDSSRTTPYTCYAKPKVDLDTAVGKQEMA